MKQEPADYWNQQQYLSINYCQTVRISNCWFTSTDKQQQATNNGNQYHQERSSGDQEKDNRYTQEILSAVVIKKATNITLGNFIAKGNYGKVVHIESLCNVTILDSEFTENVGDTVYVHSTNALISGSNFHSNIGGVLTIDSTTTFITQCNITNNINPHDSILLVTPHSLHLEQTDSITTDCSVLSSYSVVTSDTALYIGSQVSINSSISDSEDYNMHAQQPEIRSYTAYHCTDISDVLASDLRNVSDVNDIIYDFTTSNTSGSHSNKGRFCVNTDHKNPLPFINKVVFSDAETRVVLTEFESDTSQLENDSSTLTSERASIACSTKINSGENMKSNSEISSRVCDDTIHPSKDLPVTASKSKVSERFSKNITDDNQSAVITLINNTSHFGRALSIQYHYIQKSTSGNVLITSCFFTNNTSDGDGGAITIRYPNSSESIYLFKNVLITSCSFTDNTSHKRGGAVFIYSKNIRGHVLITSCYFSNNTSHDNGGAIRIHSDNSESTSENVLITSCSFTNNTSESNGGAVEIHSKYSESVCENVLITSCSFTNNTSQSHGGAVTIYSESACENVLITSCSFTNNTSQIDGGAVEIYSENSESACKNVLITSCSFTNNTSQRDGGAVGIYSENSESACENVFITSCSFTNNTSHGSGGAVVIFSQHIHGNVLITSCSFTNNTSKSDAGAVFIFFQLICGNLLISFCSFTNNTSKSFGGVITIYFNISQYTSENIFISSCSFTNNTGPHEAVCIRFLTDDPEFTVGNVLITFCSFIKNTLFIDGVGNLTVEQSNFTNSEKSIFHLRKSTATFRGDNLFWNNNGSVYAVSSKMIFEGKTLFRDNYHSAPIYVVQSHIHFNSPEGTTITNNTALLGGGIYLRVSTMTVSHVIEISQNTADYGGGIYAYLSSIKFTSERVNHIVITSNNANQNGGGICAIASTIEISKPYVSIDSNTASINGGGMYIGQSLRVNLLKQEYTTFTKYNEVIFITISNNSAQYGGGIFVDDKTADESLCDGSSVMNSGVESISSPECFFQFIKLYSYPFSENYHYVNTIMTNNTATISGDAIYGGLFDRCTVSLLAEIEEYASNGLDYISKTVAFANPESVKIPPLNISLCDKNQEIELKPDKNFSSCYYNKYLYSLVSSQAVQIKFCKLSQSISKRKGESFKVHILAMDQVGNQVNATIHASVVTDSGVGRLKEGQTEQLVGNQCTELEYNVFSQDSSAQLELYADGPCTNLGKSKRVINIRFLPCTCAVGLQPSQSKVNCVCDCDTRLQPYQITNCSQEAGTIKLENNIWIGVEKNSTSGSGYIIHECPSDYCVEKPVNINLNSSQEKDRQCAFNRSGILCGECQQGLSLVLSTSKCMKCSNIYLLLLIPFTLAGIVLVVFILLLNITIANGTVHGLIFYSNVLAANKAILLPFSTPNFLTVFISLVNLDLGIETCFYSQLNSQAKVLLQLVFPSYLFLLIFLIIVLSRYFNSFAKLLSISNPVAALATLIFLSYSTLLQFIIAALQNTVLDYPNGSKERVWLYDANVPYFSPSHIPRFAIATLILTASGLFTVLLFFSQWLPHCSNSKLMKWTKNTKYTGFMDAYHKHRYWVGLLLFALIIHNTIAAVATDTFLPVLSAGLIPAGLITLKLLSNRVYKIWLADALETLSLLNLIFLAVGIRGIKYRDQLLACISMSIAFTLFVIIISYHIYKYILVKMSIWPKVTLLRDSLKNSFRLRQANQRQNMYQVVADNQMEDDELLKAMNYNNEQPDTVDPPYTGGAEEEANPDQYHTPPRIVLATRPDQLREPDLDNLAPITTADYQPAPLHPRPKANNYQEVTHTVIDPVAAV